MFRVKKEIYIDKRNFESISEVRSSIMNIVRQNYSEYIISSEAITFYVSGGFNFNRGMEGKVTIDEDSSNYHITVVIKKSFMIPFLLLAFIVVMIMGNASETFELSVFLYRLLLFPVFYSPFLLLVWLLFYISASAKLKTLTDDIMLSL